MDFAEQAVAAGCRMLDLRNHLPPGPWDGAAGLCGPWRITNCSDGTLRGANIDSVPIVARERQRRGDRFLHDKVAGDGRPPSADQSGLRPTAWERPNWGIGA